MMQYLVTNARSLAAKWIESDSADSALREVGGFRETDKVSVYDDYMVVDRSIGDWFIRGLHYHVIKSSAMSNPPARKCKPGFKWHFLPSYSTWEAVPCG